LSMWAAGTVPTAAVAKSAANGNGNNGNGHVPATPRSTQSVETAQPEPIWPVEDR
jgi:hypothetical protein